MNSAKSYRVDEETAEKIKKLWLDGIRIDEDLKESEIVNYILKKHIKETEITEVIAGRRKRWERIKPK